MSESINTSNNFLKHLCSTLRIACPDLSDRACAITRSPATYGREGSVIIEWEGSPPHFPICLINGMPVVNYKQIRGNRAESAYTIIQEFLKAHPANADGSTVWLGIRLKDRIWK